MGKRIYVMKIITYVFLILSIMVSFPYTIYAVETVYGEETIEALEEDKQEESEEETPSNKIVGELPEKRNAFEKHFLNEDGSITAVVYPQPVHYKENNKYVDIDNSLVLIKENKEDKYKPKSNNLIDVSFAKEVNETNNILEVKNKEFSLKWRLIDNKEVDVNDILLDDGETTPEIKRNVKTEVFSYRENFNEKKEDKTILNKLTSSIKYNNVEKDIDIKYDILSNIIKESIILNSKSGIKKEYVYELEINEELEYKNETDSKIIITNPKENNEVIFEISSQLMWDNNNEFSDSIKLEIEEVNDKKILKIIPDEKWLNDENRKFPITIDPTIATSQNVHAIEDTFVYPGDTNNKTRGGAHVLRIGSTSWSNSVAPKYDVFRGLVKVTLPTLSSGDQVIEARFSIFNYQDTSEWALPSGAVYFDVHQMTSNWTESGGNWSNTNGKYKTRIEDYFVWTYSTTNKNKENKVNITRMVKDWYTTGNNYGLIIKEHAEKKQTSRKDVWFLSSNTTASAYLTKRPRVIITYRNQNGLEGYMSYQTQSIGRSQIYTNNYNGNVTLVHNDASTPGNRFPVSINHVFNNNDGILSKEIGYGIGNRLNLHQTAYFTTIGGKEYVVHTDEDGTAHYYIKNGNIYEDEDGLGLTIEKNGITELLMKDKEGNISTYKIDGATYYFLREIKDVNNNKITITYSNGRITKVADGVGDEINLTYNASNLLSKITDTSGRETTYNYDLGKHLTSIVYPDNKTSYFTYDAGHKLTSVKNIDGREVRYSYYPVRPFRVKQIKEYSSSGIEGNELNITYGDNVTKFVDKKGYTNNYIFNNIGNTITVNNLGKDTNLDNMYGSYEKYNTTGKGANKVGLASGLIKSTNNYIQNSSAEQAGVTGFTTSVYGSTNPVPTSVTTEKYIGNKSFKLESLNKDSSVNIAQNIDLIPNKTYTLSMYIKGEVIEKGPNSLGVSMFYEARDVNGGYITRFKEIKGTNELNENEFKRYTYTFTVDNNALTSKKIGIVLNKLKGTIYVDAIQLEEGEVSNPYNMIENGSFNNGTTGWYLGNLESTDVVKTINGSKAFYIKGNPIKNKHLRQNISINGNKEDVYRLTGWGLVSGVHDGLASSNKRTMLEIGFREVGTGVLKYVNVAFNTDSLGWQMAMAEAIAPCDYNEIIIHVIFGNNINEAYYKNIELVKSVKSETATYDSRGNLSGIKDTTGGTTGAYYDAESLLASIKDINNKTTIFEYDYEHKNRLLRTINPNKTSNSYEYDNNGNVTKSKTESANPTEEIKLNTAYYIKSIDKNLYIGVDTLANGALIKLGPKSNNLYQEWKFVKLSSGNIGIQLNNSNNNQAFDTTSTNANSVNMITWIKSTGTNNNQEYKTIKNEDGTYTIQTKRSNFLRCIDVKGNTHINGTSIQQYDCNGCIAQKFILEEANPDTSNNKFIETSSEYTTNGNYQTKSIDEREKEVITNYNTNRGTVSIVEDPNGNSTNYDYDINDRITSVTNNNTTNTYSYINDYLETITHNGINYNFIYDTFGNTKQIKVNNQSLITNEYETNNGNLLTSTYGNGSILEYSYDKFNRVNKLTNDLGNITYTYDNRGNLSRIHDTFNNVTKEYEYDLAGRPIIYNENNQNNEFIINNTYDVKSKVTKKTYELNNITKEINYIYDDLSRITNINDITYNYDTLSRINTKKINNNYITKYNYLDINNNKTTPLIESIENGDNKISYEYDNNGNITKILENTIEVNQYYYDNLNQLVKEDNKDLNKTIEYTYDNGGNILSKKIYEYKTTTLIDTINYSYTNTNWKDQLTEYNNKPITYDPIGNPLNYDGNTYTWVNGRQLQSITKGQNTYSYKYNEEGIRISKTINDVETKYYLEGTNIIYEERGDNVIYYTYDNTGISGLTYEGNTYYFIKNIQNDIIQILDNNLNVVANYKYTSWGDIISITDGQGNDILNNPTHIANINPYRYRGYYYDTETSLYYLNSRYYNPNICRFLNADGIIGANQDILSYNLYTYVSNNPINFSDPSGALAIDILRGIKQIFNNIVKEINNYAKKVIRKTYPDYTKELNNVLISNASQAFIMKKTLGVESAGYFYGQVKAEGDWDYKFRDKWENGIDVPYIDGKFLFNGVITTAEDFGNIHYGFIGTVMGFPSLILYMGGGYANIGKSPKILFGPYYGDDKNDHYSINRGIDMYYNWPK